MINPCMYGKKKKNIVESKVKSVYQHLPNFQPERTLRQQQHDDTHNQ